MTGRMMKIRRTIVIGLVAVVILTGILVIININTRKVSKMTVNKEMESIQSSINDDIMDGVIEYLEKVIPEDKTALSGDAYNRILESVDQSMKDSLQEKLNGTLTAEDISDLENDIASIVRQCVQDLSFDEMKPKKGIDYFTDAEIDAITKATSTLIEANIKNGLNSESEENAATISVLKARIESNSSNLKNNVKSCQDDIDALRKKIDKISNSGMSDIKTQYASLSDELSNNKSSLDSAIREVDEKAKNGINKADNNSTSIASIQGKINESQDNLDGLNSQYERLCESLNTYKESSNAAIRVVDTKATEVSNKADMALSNANNAKTAADNNASNISSLQGDIDNTKEQLDSKVSSLQGDINDTKEQLDSKVSMTIKKVNNVDTLTITSGVKKE